MPGLQGRSFPLPRYRIDYILYAPASRFRLVRGDVIDERMASDHLPVFAVLSLK